MKRHPKSTHGFALVIALSLMAFLLLLILGITTLVQVETQSTNAQLEGLRARMNARLGAMIALGDLQRYTGPDQRITARSDILLPPGQSGPAGQQRWTGVWSSKETTNDPLDTADGLGGRQPKWLVSGIGNDPNASTLDPNVAFPGETADLATLGASVIDKTNINEDDTVKAPKVEILAEDNLPSGHYAFWVSDEGVKARVNMADPHLDSADPEAAYYRTAMAQVADPTVVSNSKGIQLLAGTSSRWKDETQDPEKISSLKNIPMFLEDDLPSGTGLDGVNREFFHDFTVHSSGVLANTKDGGLKRDLSTALMNLPVDLQEGGENSPMFPPANPSSLPGQMDPGGPKWEQLSDYYKLAYDNSNLAGDAPINLRLPTNEQVGFTPVITRSNFFVQGFAERDPVREASTPPNQWCLDTTGAGRGATNADWVDGDWYYARGYRYSLGMFPLVTLWNPYDRDMVLGDLGLEFELPQIDIKEPGGAVIAEVGQDTGKYNGPASGSEEVRRRTVKFVIRGITLKAGQAVNFSPPSNSYYDKDNPINNVLVARDSAPFVTGFFTPPRNPIADAVFWDNPPTVWNIYDKWTKSSLMLGFNTTGGNSNPSLWRQLVMLYSSTDMDGAQFRSENRIKTIDINATGKFDSGWQQPRVILTHRLMGLDNSGRYAEHINPGASNPNYRDPFTFANPSSSGTSYFSDFVGPTGDSARTNPQGSIDLIVGNTLSDNGLARRNPWGAYGAMRFPDSPVMTFASKGKEHEMHLFLYMNPTAPVIPKEPNITWNSSNEGMSELNVYGKWHVAPWRDGDRVMFYDEVLARGTDTEEAYVGLSNDAIDGSLRAVLFEVPDNIPLNIGQLAHANLMNHDVFSPGSTRPAIGNVVVGNGGRWNTNTLQNFATPSYAIGNSLASPFLELEKTEQWSAGVRTPWVNEPAGYYDYSYKLNEALWDEYFFSGITDADPVFPLPNGRLSLSDPLSSSSDLTLENRAAANLLLDGAFNINSTSVAAWEAVLGAMREIETSGHSLDSTLRHNFARFHEPQTGMPTNGESVPQLSNKDEITAGYRNLTDAQIARLASEIVDEIHLRSSTPDANNQKYPFLSLSDFVNRSPKSNTEAFARRGALQAAIDEANLNGLESDSTGLWAESAEYPLYYESGDTPIIDRPKADGLPGAFMQSDLLAKIGAFIQARSDTFTIRSFGSSQEQFGSKEGARAYYEMVVQRTPAYVDPGDNAHEDATLAVNRKFGRSYEIKSQRWVAADEI